MPTWFECKVKYDRMQDEKVRRVAAAYLVDALSFTEAEGRIIEELKPFIGGDFALASIKRSRIVEIFRDDDGDRWFQVKWATIEIDEKGNERRSVALTLVLAFDLEGAVENFKKGMKNTMYDYSISSIAETSIMDVFDVKLGDKSSND